jgi:hypothetical protein
MPGVTRGGGKGAVLVDVHEDFNGYDVPASLNSWQWLSRGAVPLRVQPGNAFVLVWTLVRVDAAQGTWCVEVPSNGASRAVQQMTGYSFPLGRNNVGQVGYPAMSRPLQQYYWRRPVRVPVRGPARIEMGVSLNNGGLSLLGTDPAAVWTSDPALNAGAWTPQFRSTVAGAITTAPATAISPSTTEFQTLGLRLTERAGGSLLEWIINDVTRFSVVVPVTMAALQFFNPICGLGIGAGTTARWGEQRFTVTELGGS